MAQYIAGDAGPRARPAFSAQQAYSGLRSRAKVADICERLGHSSLGGARVEDLAAEVPVYVKHCLDRGNKPTTIRRSLSALKSAWHHWEDTQGPLPAWRTVKLPASPQEPTATISERDYKRVCEALSPAARIGFQLLYFTAARRSELVNAKWSQVDLASRVITIPLSKSGNMLSALGIRSIGKESVAVGFDPLPSFRHVPLTATAQQLRSFTSGHLMRVVGHDKSSPNLNGTARSDCKRSSPS